MIEIVNFDDSKRVLEEATVAFDRVYEFVAIRLGSSESFTQRERVGGYFCIARGDTGIPLLVKGIGLVSEDKQKKYFDFAQEKASRLASHSMHNTSAQSRNDEAQQYAGAIRGSYGLIFSFSGMEQVLDEVICLTVAVMCRQLSTESANSIVSPESKKLFDSFCAWLKSITFS